MTAKSIAELKREALADLNAGWQANVDSFGASLEAQLARPLLAPFPRRFWRYVPADSSWTIGQMVEVSADVAAAAAVEGRTI
jgi:hypothetical protein